MASGAETILEVRPLSADEAGSATTELFRRHRRMVLGLCRTLLRDPAEAEDATQQTFLSAYRSLLGGTRPRQPAAWLATIARNECWARTRDRMREPLAEPDPENAGDGPDPLDATIRKADLAALWSAIEDLPPQQRDALVMREFSGLTYEQLAKELDVTQPAVESLLFRARRELRVRLRPIFAPAVVPVAAIREIVLRLLGDSSSASLVAKVTTAPAVAKLAAGTAAVGLVAGGVVAVDPQLVVRQHGPAGTPHASLPVAKRPVQAVHRAAPARTLEAAQPAATAPATSMGAAREAGAQRPARPAAKPRTKPAPARHRAVQPQTSATSKRTAATRRAAPQISAAKPDAASSRIKPKPRPGPVRRVTPPPAPASAAPGDLQPSAIPLPSGGSLHPTGPPNRSPVDPAPSPAAPPTQPAPSPPADGPADTAPGDGPPSTLPPSSDDADGSGGGSAPVGPGGGGSGSGPVNQPPTAPATAPSGDGNGVVAPAASGSGSSSTGSGDGARVG